MVVGRGNMTIVFVPHLIGLAERLRVRLPASLPPGTHVSWTECEKCRISVARSPSSELPHLVDELF